MPALASVFVPVRPEFGSFARDTKAGLAAGFNAAEADARVAGGKTGRAYGKRVAEEGGKEMKGGLGKQAKETGELIAGAFAVEKVVEFFKDSITAASDLNEAGNKLQVTFGSATSNVQQWAQGAAQSFGLSTLAAEDAATTFGTFAKSAGLSGSAAAGFSEQMGGLAGDLASFYNTSPDQAIEAIGAALRGESEPIRQYGVLLDDATLRQQAMAMGITSTTKQALTPQQRVLAAQAVILKQTTAAQGDFARTSGGLANQQRILAAEFENVKGQVGQALLPIMLEVIGLLRDTGIPVLRGFGAVMGAIPPQAFALAAGVGGVVLAVRAGTKAFEAGSAAAKTIGDVILFLARDSEAAAVAQNTEAAASVKQAAANEAGAAAAGAQAAAAGEQAAANDAAAASAGRMGAAFGTAVGRLTASAGAIGLVFGAVQVANWLSGMNAASVSTDNLADSMLRAGSVGNSPEFRHLFDRAGIGNFTVDTQSAGEALHKFANEASDAFGQGLLQSGERLLSFGTSAHEADADLAKLDDTLVAMARGGNAAGAAAMFAQLSGELTKAGYSTTFINRVLPKYTQAAADSARASADYAASVARVDAAQRAALPAADRQYSTTRGAMVVTQAYAARMGDTARLMHSLATPATAEHTQALGANTSAGRAAAQVMGRVGSTLTGMATALHTNVVPATHTQAQALTDVQNAAYAAYLKERLLADANRDGTTTTKEWNKYLDTQYKALQKVSDAALGQWNADIGLRGAQADLTQAVKDNGRTLDLNTAKGRANATALQAVASQTRDALTAHKDAGEPMRQFSARVQTSTDKLIDEAQKAGMSRAAAKKYADAILAVPRKQVTEYVAQNIAKARGAAQQLKADLDKLRGVQTITLRANTDGSFTKVWATAAGGVRSSTMRAAGGPIPGHSPTPTADNVPVMATAGEHMWSVAEVKAAGGHQAVAGLRQAALAGTLQALAAGGPVRTARQNYTANLPHSVNANFLAALNTVGNYIGKGMAANAAAAAMGGAGMTWQQEVAILRRVFPHLQVFSTYRPGARTVTGGVSYHARGMAVDVTPSMSIFDWIASHYPQSAEIIYSPAGRRQIHNGRPYFYTGAVRAEHFNHVHWAYGAGHGGPSAGFTGAGGGNAGNMRLGQSLAASYGWTGNQWLALRSLWMGESGWNNYARNRSSGAFGIPQALPPSKMGANAAAGNAYAQIIWGLRYIRDAYGSPMTAWTRWNARRPHWYDSGGWIPPGGVAYNGTARPERVLDGQESSTYAAARAGRARGGGGGGMTVHVYLDGARVIDDRIRVVVEDGFNDAGSQLD